MLLKRLELSGFKSFARPTALSFTTPITAIVGPNGSGKSNISESVRFVLGEQSMKSLRGKRGEDLIFNGTHSISRQEKASVTIVFDNTKRVFNVDYDEVAVRRVVFRDSTSEYFVNGTRVRLKDILELLAAVHIGASSHHIISQGESDRILLASFKERRNMIEDALGLKIYHYKKQESERKLLKTNENLGQVKALRKEIAPHLEFLERQVAKIKQAERLREELRQMYAEYSAREEFFLRAETQSLVAERQPTDLELKDVESRVLKLKNILSAVGGKKNTTAERAELLARIEETRRNRDSLSRTLGKLEGAIEYEEKVLEEKTHASDNAEEVAVPSSSLKALREAAAALGEKAEREENAVQLRDIFRNLKDAVFSFCDFLIKGQSAREAVARMKTALTEKRGERENKAKEFADLAKEEERLRDAYRKLEEEIEEGSGKERETERELFEFQNRKTELKAKIELLTMKESQHESARQAFLALQDEARALIGTLPHIEVSSSSDRLEQEKRRRAIERLKIRLEEASVGGSETLKEYSDVKERDEFLQRETADLEKSRDALKKLIDDLEEKIEEQFRDGVRKINERFKDFFILMFGGGRASIQVIKPPPSHRKKTRVEGVEVSEENDFKEEEEAIEEAEEGIDIDVSLPRKKIRGLHMLSGGERSLVSIALIFAMTQVNPPPFLILDETDAALDEVNSKKYGEMLKKISKETELILITHNRETMSCAGVLYGVTAIDGVSRVLSVKFEEAKEIAETV